jgi:hypothetical protein
MIQGEQYRNFIKFVREQLRESERRQVNGFEVLVDYYIDFPPEGLDESDSDYFREEVDRLVQDQITEVESTLIQKETDWLLIEGGKWRLLATGEKIPDIEQTILERNLEPFEHGLLNVSVLEIDDDKREQLERLYKGKVEKHGSTQEKYNVISLIAKSYTISRGGNADHVGYLVTAGRIGRELEEESSYEYFESAAKHYRSIYEYEQAAENYKEAVDAAERCNVNNGIVLSLIKNMRIQYELCSDEDNASDAFIRENQLKAKEEDKRHIKIILFTLGFLSDYCQNPKKVALWALVLIFLSACIYAFSGITPSGGGEQTIFAAEKNFCRVLMDSVYFSVVTFTTLGYGDYAPSNYLSRLMANIEALGGLFFTSLFLVTLVRKYGR